MTFRELRRLLKEGGVPDPDAEARYLFCFYSGKSMAAVLAEPQASCDVPALSDALRRRCEGEPSAYITGEASFCNETYRVTPDCLIPRFDTERLVEIATGQLPANAVFADLCTGSGCVAVSTLCRRPDCRCDAYELSEVALSLARENAGRNRVASRIAFTNCDLLTTDLPVGKYDMILSNPPYIREDVIPTLSPEVQREPRMALSGGPDGCIFYRRFLTAFRKSLKAGGSFLFEIGYDQWEALSLLAQELGYTATLYRDYGGNPRVVHFQ